MLEVENLGYSYGPHRVLDGLSFSLGEGELFAVLGPNGAGKSTLFRCLLGLAGGYSGSIRIEGREVSSLSARGRARLMAYIPQAHEAAFDYSVLDIVLMGAASARGPFETPSRADERAARATLARLGIESLADRCYRRVSGGERQLVLIARALAQNTRLLIMDEPTANLDYGNQTRVMAEVARLAGSGYSIILSTHNPEQAFLWGTRAAVLYGGRFRADGLPSKALSESLLSEVYGVELKLYSLPAGAPAGYRCCLPAAAPQTAPEHVPGAASEPAGAALMPVTAAGAAAQPQHGKAGPQSRGGRQGGPV